MGIGSCRQQKLQECEFKTHYLDIHGKNTPNMQRDNAVEQITAYIREQM
jgi:hypothetical protein